jgi:DNA-directed RNA polymerase specialized sigma subunit
MTERLESVIAALPKEQQEAIAQQTMQLVAEEMSLRELRKARERSQRAVGEILDINQAAVSKIERRTDMYVSTLRSFVEAMGGELEIIARFPDRAPIIINQFEELA